MAGAFERERLLRMAGASPALGAFSEPEGVPDLGFGPMTPTTMAGMPNAELSIARPSPLREDFDSLLKYGPMLAQAETDLFNGATDGWSNAIADPTLPKIGGAAVRTAALLPSAKVIGGTAAGAFGLAGLDDLLDATGGFAPSASAEESDMIRTLRENARAAREEAGKDVVGKGKAEADRMRIQRAEAARVAEQAYTSALAAEEARTSKLAEIEATTAAERKATQDAVEARRYNEAVKGARVARDSVLTKAAPEFKDTTVGNLYQEAGGLQNMAAGFVPGFLRGLAGKSAGSAGMSVAEGAFAGGMTANVPDLYNASMADTLNPERQSLVQYMYNLPDGHDDIAKTRKRIEDSATMPYLNPIRTEAQSTLVSPLKLLGRTLGGAGEGAVGAASGLVAPEAARGAVKYIGDMAYEAGKIPKALAQGFKDGYKPASAGAPVPPASPKGPTSPAGPKQPDLSGMGNNNYVPPKGAGPNPPPNNPPPNGPGPDKNKSMTRLWAKAFDDVEKVQSKQQAIEAIRAIQPNKGLSGIRAGVNKRRMIKAIEKSKSNSPKDWAQELRDLKAFHQANGTYKIIAPVTAGGLGLNAATRDQEQD